jgi:hypothetical protein
MGALQVVTILLRLLLQSRAALAAENLALRQQVDVPPLDWSGYSVRIEVRSLLDCRREAARSGVSRRPQTALRTRRNPRKSAESLVGRQGLEQPGRLHHRYERRAA